MKHGKTAAYTILKNEIKYIDTWLYYTKDFDYRVLLDTGSTDGSYEELKRRAASDPGLIVEQKTFTPWRFDVARQYNLAMVPSDTKWCLSPDLDEYFSINVIPAMEKLIDERPDVTNIATTRLDIYSPDVFVGPPKHLGSNKIHRYGDYTWFSPIYEHLRWVHKDRPEVEIHSPDIFLIHDQDFRKPDRQDFYLSMLLNEYKENPKNCWTLWFLVNHYFKEKDLANFIKTGCDFIRNHDNPDNKYFEVLNTLTGIYFSEPSISEEQRINILETIKGRSI